MNIGKFYTSKKQEYNYSDKLEECIKKTCTYCIDYTFNADQEKQNSPIMMLGKIQSGKTRAFTGVIALAFDNDFDMVFILTKSNKALVQQTESRMKKEFKPFIKTNEIEVKNIIKMSYNLTGYQLEKKLIIIAKKEKNNLNKLIQFIDEYSIKQNKKTIIIDDEADTTGIGYGKNKENETYDLRAVASKVNEIRGNLDGCVFVQVTATPYALYLQPEFTEGDIPRPIKPKITVLVPSGEGYIGGEYYFIQSREQNHPARFLFEPVAYDEHLIVSDQKRKGKKSKIDDRRSFKEEEILVNEDRLPVFKRGIVNFLIGAIVLREINNCNSHYAYVIHTARQKGSHISLKNIADTLFNQIRSRNKSTDYLIENLLIKSYEDIKQSVEAYGFYMPKYETIKQKFFEAIDREYYRVDVVNSDKDIEDLLDEETGELNLSNPFSIFVGGQALDRGVTISNLIGFYYGRSPLTMQQDTVLQHSRMYGYRIKELLAVTRFYTTERIHYNMQKITEIDMDLRSDIENNNLGSGVYFITQRKQEGQNSKYGKIIPCSPDKIRVSDIIFLRPQKRIFPIGFTPISKVTSEKYDKKILKKLRKLNIDETIDGVNIPLSDAEEIIHFAYMAIRADEDSINFLSEEELIISLRYLLKDKKMVPIIVRKERNLAKYRYINNIKVLSNAPDTPTPLNIAKEIAINIPVLMLLQETGESDGWDGRSFWWPIVVSPNEADRTIYASKLPSQNMKNNNGSN